jgi:predicted nucleic acid-binding protein
MGDAPGARRRVFCDTSVLIRYWAADDPPRALAAAELMERDDVEVVISTAVLLEAIHALRTAYDVPNPAAATLLIDFLSRANVRLADADAPLVIEALRWTMDRSARRIPDAILGAAAEHADCDAIATFDAKLASPSVPVRML